MSSIRYTAFLSLAFSCTLAGITAAQEPEPGRSTTPWEPKVVFSAEQARTCTIDVGDAFPAATLANLAGGEVTVGEALAEGMTLVVFWDEQFVGGVQVRNQLVRVLGDTDVKLITVYVGDDRKEAEKIVATDPNGQATHTTDDGSLWNAVAKKSQPPRLFLVKNKKVVWLDIEYSQGAQQEMLNAIRYFAQP